MVRDVLVDVAPGEVRLAVLENGEAAEVYIEKRETESLIGNIYRGKVERVLPGMESAFVDIGLDKNAFLYIKDVCPEEAPADISELLTQGQEITVQVIKDSAGTKGPRVTTRLSIPGHYVVLMPGSHAAGVSKKIQDDEERKRLKDIALGHKPQNAGIVVRTAAEDVAEEQLTEDINVLEELWRDLLIKEQRGAVPRLLYREPDMIVKAVREYLRPDIGRLLINSREEYGKILASLDTAAPGIKAKVEYFSKDYDMFEYYHVESAIDEALSRRVWLKSGAYLIFDRTEALTVIDVNSGKYVGRTGLEETALKINLEAAETIAKQVRLRDLSGIIIADFIDMQRKEHREQVVQMLREAVKHDKTPTVVVGITNLGLVEMTRKKVRQPLYKSLTVDCRACRGAGYRISPVTAARRIEKRMASFMADAKGGCIEVHAHPEIYKVLNGSEKENIERLKLFYHCDLKLQASNEAGYEEASFKLL